MAPNDTTGARILWACNHDPLRRTFQQIALAAGLPVATFQRMRKPGYEGPHDWDRLTELCRTLQIRMQWLRTGVGSPRPEGYSADADDEEATEHHMKTEVLAPIPGAHLGPMQFCDLLDAVRQGFLDAGHGADTHWRPIVLYAWSVATTLKTAPSEEDLVRIRQGAAVVLRELLSGNFGV